jgi:hypothetical protein
VSGAGRPGGRHGTRHEGHPEESWEGWTRRVATDLAALAEGGWETFAVHADVGGARDEGPATARSSGLFRRRHRGESVSAADVFVQASRLEGVLVLECVADPEFEGLTALATHDVEALTALGWETVADEADLGRVLGPDAAEEAAALVAATLRDVLGATAPSAVDRRHG